MKKAYRTIGHQGKANEQDLARFLSSNGQFLLPTVNLVEQCRLAFDDLIAMAGRATIQAVLELSAAASLIEGLEECFTINRLGLPPSLMRCLGTTNVIESPHAGVRIRTRRVTYWQDGKMKLRWLASAFLQTEKHFRKIMGHRELWILKTALEGAQPAAQQLAA